MKHAVTMIQRVTTQLAAALCCATGAFATTPISDKDRVFFETRIRPVLVERCHSCHSLQAEKLKANLFLDTQAGILRGSDTGPVVIPGSPDTSRLIHALRYDDPNLQMPPKGKLPGAVIEDFVEWIQRGAPWPQDAKPESTKTADDPVESGTREWLKRRSQHWAYQPIDDVIPPKVADDTWSLSGIDQFIARSQKAAGLSPAAPADRRTLIRRVTFNLTGLPPSPEEVERFLNDESPQAFSKVVDRLLASPQYGERWARHWLDLVRYSETLGFEFDFDLYHAWRYRDYVIRAYNQDLPYNDFVIEHLAGNLLETPRRRPENQTNESVVATGFFWMEEGRQSPVDIRQEQTDVIDGQINVLGKAFLGQTIACARCHDHKFDAITTRDYYALAGYLKSSRYQNAFIDPPTRHQRSAQDLSQLKKQIHQEILTHQAPRWQTQFTQIHHYLLATAQDPQAAPQEAGSPNNDIVLDERLLSAWSQAIENIDKKNESHPLHPWIHLSRLDSNRAAPFDERMQPLLKPLAEDHADRESEQETTLFADFGHDDYDPWQTTGPAFGLRPADSGDFLLGPDSEHPITSITLASAHSGLLSERFQGDLRSASFTISSPFVHCLIAGNNSRLNLVIDGYRLIMNPMYGGLTLTSTNAIPQWKTMDVQQWIGHRAYFELSDSSIPRYRLNPPPSKGTVPEKPSGYTALHRIAFSDSPRPPMPSETPFNTLVKNSSGLKDLRSVAVAYSNWASKTFECWRTGQTSKLTQSDLNFLNWLLNENLVTGPTDESSSTTLTALFEQYCHIENQIPSPRRAPALTDGTGEDEYVLIRGSHRNRGMLAPRQVPEVFQTSLRTSDEATTATLPTSDGSQRLSLAKRLTDSSNPLLARVMVNRIWQHHFGEGIVRTPDDFGRMGQDPSHPKLLDYLAREFMRSGGSIKTMHRKILLSKVYHMSSQSNPNAHEQDPDNRLLHHFPIRRLEAEAIRDSILSVSGRLEEQMEGPSVLPYLTAHMEGRGRPESGPLDGAGRRSIYINTRRNFLTPLFVAYDYPAHFSTQGKRVVSAVPEQAMTLLNDPFVMEQANHWAQNLLSTDHPSSESRIRGMFKTAYSREPSPTELDQARTFLNQHKQWHECDLTDPRPWADLAHVLFNVKEFIFIN